MDFSKHLSSDFHKTSLKGTGSSAYKKHQWQDLSVKTFYSQAPLMFSLIELKLHFLTSVKHVWLFNVKILMFNLCSPLQC